jgi:prevent-host-death family protein
MREETKAIGATAFKARCLKLIQQVHDRKLNAVVITKRGKPVAKVVPVYEPARSLRGMFQGKLKIRGDITRPLGVEWDALADGQESE